MDNSAIRVSADRVTISLRVVPNASKSEFAGMRGDSIKVRLNAKPVDGAANKELIRFISKELRLPKSSISIVRGERSREKLVAVESIDQNTRERVVETLEKLI